MEEGEQLLVASFKKVEDRGMVLKNLDRVLATHYPFSLYIATKDRTDCMWIFDPDTTYSMIGGKNVYDSVFDSLFPSVEDKRTGIAMFLLRKVGPIVTLKLNEDIISNISQQLIQES
jgi:hypothetical protein